MELVTERERTYMGKGEKRDVNGHEKQTHGHGWMDVGQRVSAVSEKKK